jgi:hypothetical protein
MYDVLREGRVVGGGGREGDLYRVININISKKNIVKKTNSQKNKLNEKESVCCVLCVVCCVWCVVCVLPLQLIVSFFRLFI